MNNNDWRSRALPVQTTQPTAQTGDDWRSRALPVQEETIQQPVQPESFLEKIPRVATQFGSRGAESVLGIPKDLLSVVSKMPPYQLMKDILGVSPVAEAAEKLPGSQELRQFSEKATKGYTAPRGPVEEFGGNVAGDLAQLLLPVKGKMPFARTLGTAIAGNVGQEVSKAFGAGEKGQALTKLGSMFLAGSINFKGANKYNQALYDEADKLLPEGAKVSATSLENNLSGLEKSLKKGIEAPSEKKVVDVIDKLKGKIKDGKINLDEITASKRSLNEIMGDPELLSRGRKLLKEVHKSLSDTLEQASQKYPEFVKTYQMADETYGVLQQSKKFTNQIKRYLDKAHITSPIGLAFGVMYPKAVPGIIAGYGGLKGVEVIKRINSSPTLRKYYLNTVNQTLKGNQAVALTNLKKLDQEYSQEKTD